MLRWRLETFAQPGADGLLFPAPGCGHMTRDYFRNRWVKARRAAGRPDMTWHDLRHTGNTLAGQAGATDAELMARAGHADKSAGAIYQHSTRERNKRIAKRLSRIAAKG
jgi:integrase